MATPTLQPNPSFQRSAIASTSATQAACTWPGHCLGAACLSNDDCDNDWICTNKVCGLCCETISTGTTSTLPTPSSAATEAPQKKIGTGPIVGIAVCVVVAFVIIMGIIWWFWRVRRHRSKTELDGSSAFPAALGSQEKTPMSPAYAQEHWLAESPGELPAPGPRPAELESHELAELEGDNKAATGATSN